MRVKMPTRRLRCGRLSAGCQHRAEKPNPRSSRCLLMITREKEKSQILGDVRYDYRYRRTCARNFRTAYHVWASTTRHRLSRKIASDMYQPKTCWKTRTDTAENEPGTLTGPVNVKSNVQYTTQSRSIAAAGILWIATRVMGIALRQCQKR